MAGQALKNTDRSDYLFTQSTQSALTLAKHLRDVQDEVQPERVALISMDQCAMATRVSGLLFTKGHVNFAKFIKPCAAMLTVDQQHFTKCDYPQK